MNIEERKRRKREYMQRYNSDPEHRQRANTNQKAWRARIKAEVQMMREERTEKQ
jgi:hypothetical protein